MEYTMGSYQVAVIGAGHAGIEAALAAARLGAKTAIFTMSLDAIGNMPCNPRLAAPPRATWCGRSTRWAARWERRRTPPSCRAGCSTGARARRCTACASSRTARPTTTR